MSQNLEFLRLSACVARRRPHRTNLALLLRSPRASLRAQKPTIFRAGRPLVPALVALDGERPHAVRAHRMAHLGGRGPWLVGPERAESKSYLEYQGQPGVEQAGRLASQGNRAQDLRCLCARGYPRLRSGRTVRKIPSGPARQRRAKSPADSSSGPVPAFPGAALLALLADAFTRPYPAGSNAPVQGLEPRPVGVTHLVPEPVNPPCPSRRRYVLAVAFAGISRADDPAAAVREGLASYDRGEFDKCVTGLQRLASNSMMEMPARPRLPRSTWRAPRIAKVMWRKRGSGT